MQAARSKHAPRENPNPPLCPTAELMDFLGRKHMMHVLRMFGTRSTLRFHEIAEQLKSSPNTLSIRLAELVEAGVLDRRVFAEVPPRVDYSLTERGRHLLTGVMAFDEYLRRYAAPSGKP